MTGRLLRRWQRWTLWSLCFDGTITWFASDDVHERRRKVDVEIQLPKWPWRAWCWRHGHSEHYGECIYCGLPLEGTTTNPREDADA